MSKNTAAEAVIVPVAAKPQPPRSAAVSGLRSSLAAVGASVATTSQQLVESGAIEVTIELAHTAFELELAPLSAPKPAFAPLVTRSLITPDVAAAAASRAETNTVPTTTVEVAPAPRQTVPGSLSPVKTTPILIPRGFGALPRPAVTPRYQGSSAKREAVVAFSSFACVGAVACMLASGLLNFGARPVSAKDAAPTPSHAATVTITASVDSQAVLRV